MLSGPLVRSGKTGRGQANAFERGATFIRLIESLNQPFFGAPVGAVLNIASSSFLLNTRI
ncbi:MAG: hypothetical protein CVU64_13535 [Deltaproteobacteria bacterium HGW-Deltaproteobacteria-21]|nr:MAG: hypothetical protein CVU64_13535 [Deltaproteobacteria bacterium HGW-Deltaproteobacteria-21]